MSRQNKSRIGAAVLLFALVLCAVLWTVRPRSWDDIAKGHTPSSLAGNLLIDTFDLVDEVPVLDSDVWQLTAEQAEGPAADAILAALGSSPYRGRLRNIVSYSLFRQSSYTYAVDGENSRGEIHLHLVCGPQWDISLTVFSGGMVTFRDHNSRTGTLFFDTDPQVYEALSAVIKEYGSFQNG